MDGEWVSGLLSENGGGEGNPAPTNLTYKQIFDKVLPYYLSIGMTADEFWHGDVHLAKAYREAYKLRRKDENFNLWLQGRYIYEALCCASPLFRSFGKGTIKAHDYADKPYDLYEEDRKKTEETKERVHQQKMLQGMQERMAKINKKFKK